MNRLPSAPSLTDVHLKGKAEPLSRAHHVAQSHLGTFRGGHGSAPHGTLCKGGPKNSRLGAQSTMPAACPKGWASVHEGH